MVAPRKLLVFFVFFSFSASPAKGLLRHQVQLVVLAAEEDHEVLKYQIKSVAHDHMHTTDGCEEKTAVYI